MRKILFIIILALILTIPEIYACINPSDNYAVEVVLNKPDISYNLNILKEAGNLIYQNNQYSLQSAYSKDVAAIILEAKLDEKNYLSVRLQLPTKTIERKTSYITFTTKSNKNLNPVEDVEWKIECSDDNPISKCSFNKNNITITANLISAGKYSIYVEILNPELKLCGIQSCNGKCLYYAGVNVCLEKIYADDVEDILTKAGLIDSIDDFTLTRLERGVNTIPDLEPLTNNIDWQEALRQELVFLKDKGIIEISRQDIEKISQLAKQGASGNSRIVYGENLQNEKKWLYYNEIKFPLLTKAIDCKEFSTSLIPTGAVAFPSIKISTYYSIPIIIFISMLSLFIILLIVARIIEKEKKKKALKTRIMSG